MRSQRSASFMKCVEMKIVTWSCRASAIRRRQKLSRATGSTPEVGSSRISSSGLRTMATASDRRWRTPMGRFSGSASRTASRLKRAAISSTRANLGLGHVEQPGVQHQVLFHRQLAVQREGLRHVADAAARVDVPRIDLLAEQPGAASLAGSRPVSIFMVVDLPQPFEPRKPKISPCGCGS